MKLRVSKTLFIILGFAIFLIGSCLIFFFSQEEAFGPPTFIIENAEVWQLDFDWDARTRKVEQLTNDGFKKSLLKVAPDQEKIGYYKHLYSKPIYQDEASYYENYLALMVYDLIKGEEKEVFRGDYHFGDWEWISSREIVLYRGCGTECVGFWRVNIETGEKNAVHYGVGYQWSPDKKYVLAYHYTFYGITVGDKFGNEVFNLQREKDKIFPKLAEKTKGVWSPDSEKLALIVKKENEEKLELLIFDVENNFRMIYQNDLVDINFSDFSWVDVKTVSCRIGGEIKKIETVF